MAALKDLTHQLYKEVFENEDLAIIDDLVTEDVVDHEAPPGLEEMSGRDGIREAIRGWVAAFGPLRVEIHEQYEVDDTVIVRATFHGTHRGEFFGFEPTGRPFSMEVIDILRFEDGRMAEHWGQSDILGALVQTGAIDAG